MVNNREQGNKKAVIRDSCFVKPRKGLLPVRTVRGQWLGAPHAAHAAHAAP